MATKFGFYSVRQWGGNRYIVVGPDGQEIFPAMSRAKAQRKADKLDLAAYERQRKQFNPRFVSGSSTILRNIAVVKITRNRDGTVGIVARRNAPEHKTEKCRNPQYRVYHSVYYHKTIEARSEKAAMKQARDEWNKSHARPIRGGYIRVVKVR